MIDIRKREERLQLAQFLARLELTLAFGSHLLLLFLWVAKPGGPSPMLSSSGISQFAPTAAEALGVAMLTIGLAWIVRIYRADPEPGDRTWRYRRF